MNQNDYIAIGLGTLVVGGLALFGSKLAKPPSGPGPQPQPGPQPGPFPPPPAGDPQYEAARRALETIVAALQAQGGGTQPQRDQAATALEAQATTLEASGQSPAAVALLRQGAQQLRSGQLPNVPPSPNPTPTPGPLPFPFPFPPATSTPAPVGTPSPAAPGTPPAPPSAELLRARDAIARAEREIAEAPGNRRAVADLLAASAAAYSDRAAAEAMRTAAARLASGAATGQAAPASDDLSARYKELRDHCADFLQGARTIDPATLGAADRTTSDLLRAGDTNRSADLGALATASYARAGIARPAAVPA